MVKNSKMNALVKNIVQNPNEIANHISAEAENLSKMADALQNALIRFKSEPLIDFPLIIKTRRKELKMNGELVAELSGISRTAYQKIESGKSSPKLETIMAICHTLGLTLCVM